MSLEQIEQMVRAANPVPDVAILGGSVSHRGHLIQRESSTTETDEMLLVDRTPDAPTIDQGGRPGPILRSLNGEQVGDVDDRDAHTTAADDLARERHPARRWMLVAAATIAVLALGLLAVTAVQEPDSIQTNTVPPTPAPSTNPATTSPSPPVDSLPATIDTAAPVLPPGPFVGIWLSTDTDGSSQTMEILGSVTEEYEIVVRDDYAGVCSGASSTMVGTGRLQTDEVLVIAQPAYTCDDGSTPETESGPPLHEQLANLTFVHDPATDQLLDSLGLGWRREGAENAGDPAPSETTAAPPPGAEQQAVIDQLVDAVNTAAADDTRDEPGLPDVFTEDAVISPLEGWDESPVTDPGLVGAWILHLQAWGFEGDVTTQECWTEASAVICAVRARWHTLLAEEDEYWGFTFVGDRIKTLTVTQSGERFGDPILPLSLADLDGWEDWLQRTDPDAAARLVPDDDTSRPFPVVPRYDPGLAEEITASIQLYLEQRPPGDEISITADLVDFGDRLVGLIGNMARAEGRTYVIAGRYETEGDLLTMPEEAVLAAFDDAGRELWRTELGGTPTEVVAVAGDVWVLHGTGELSRIDASDGRFIDRVTVGDAWSVFAAFGSVWVYALDLEGGPGQLIRVHPDLSTTTIELPASIVNLDDVPQLDPAVGAGGIWVPLGGAGVAVVDVETGQVVVISVEDIGHEVGQVAVDGDVAYLASRYQVTSIVDGEVWATVSPGEIRYLGRVEGVFGAQSSQGFVVLRADDPMKVEVRQVSTEGWGAREIDGEAWREEGRNYNLRRIEFLPVPEVDAR